MAIDFDSYFDSVLSRLEQAGKKREFIDNKKVFLESKKDDLRAIFNDCFKSKLHLFSSDLTDDQEMELFNLKRDFWFAMVGACDPINGSEIFENYLRVESDLSASDLSRSQMRELEYERDELLETLERDYAYYEPFPDMED